MLGHKARLGMGETYTHSGRKLEIWETHTCVDNVTPSAAVGPGSQEGARNTLR